MKSGSSLWLLFSIVVICSIQCIYCGVHSSPGETLPPRLEIKINSSANITCRINPSKFGGNVNSSSLYFEEEDTGNRVPENDIDIINDTTIVLMLQNAKEQDRNYVCKSGMMGIGVTHVSVGTAPLDVTDFKCRGYDYTYMVCNFTKPHNVILTQYNLSYTAQTAFRKFIKKDKNGTRIYHTTYSQNYMIVCNLEIQEYQGICNLTKDKNNYRPNYEFYNFTLTGKNDVGVNVQSFWINHYESVIPPKPEYTFEKITTNSTVIKWYNPKYSFYTAKGLEYDVRLRPKDKGVDWMHPKYVLSNINRSEFKLIVNNLPFAYFWYEISVRLRVKRSPSNYDDDDYWSEPYVQAFQTLACPPQAAPLTDAGSFYIDSSETKVRLYWKQLLEVQENGPDFEYIIKQIKRDNNEVHLKPLHLDRTSAVFHWNKHHNYTFVIKSRNSEGESPENSTIFIPRWSKHNEHNEYFMSPQGIRNVYHATNFSYTLSWSPPTNQTDLMNYTVFWCQQKKGKQNECENTIYFKKVDKFTTSYDVISNKEQDYILAVSANYRDFNSGMQWPMCAADVTSELAKMKPETIGIKSRSITIQWSLENVCPSLVEGFTLKYCRISRRLSASSILINNNVEETCLEDLITLKIQNTQTKYIMTNLKPFSSYQIQINMFSNLKPGNFSDALIVNTEEEAPSKPLNLKAENITSNSALLSWSPPKHHNGILKEYRIEYNNDHHIIDCLKNHSICNQRHIKFKLEYLSSFTTYKVYIVAYTTAASDHSNDITIETLVGIPSIPLHISTEKKSRQEKILQWSRPSVPSGRVEFYEVAIIEWYKDQEKRKRISGVVGSTGCVYNAFSCMDGDYHYTVKVRAVNVVLRDTEIDHYIFTTRNLTNDYDDASADILPTNDDLKCVGVAASEEEQLAVIQRFRNSQKYVQYKSAWVNADVFQCVNAEISRITMLALLVVVSSLGVMAAFYVARNKYQKMADISCDLPPALVAMAYATKDNGAGDGGDFRRSKDSYFNNESRRLLSSISHDSGYACNNGGGGGLNGITSCSLGKSSGYMGSDHCTEYCTQETFVAADGISSDSCIIEPAPVVDDAYMVMELLKSNDDKMSATSSSSTTAFDNLLSNSDNNGGYVQPSLTAIAALSGTKNTQLPMSNTQLPSSFMPSENGYVKQHTQFPSTFMSSTDNGYIKQIPPTLSQVQHTQMIPSENGYIKPNNLFNWPMDKLSQTTTTSSSATVAQMQAPTEMGDFPINSSGYVAPQLLLQKPLIQPPTSDGYTSLEALGKSLKPTQSIMSQTFINPDGGGVGGGRVVEGGSNLPPISGYVTQKELSAFGQQQQLN